MDLELRQRIVVEHPCRFIWVFDYKICDGEKEIGSVQVVSFWDFYGPHGTFCGPDAPDITGELTDLVYLSRMVLKPDYRKRGIGLHVASMVINMHAHMSHVAVAIKPAPLDRSEGPERAAAVEKLRAHWLKLGLPLTAGEYLWANPEFHWQPVSINVPEPE